MPTGLVSGRMKVAKFGGVANPMPVDVTVAAVFAVVAEVELRLSSQNVLNGTVPVAVDSVLVLIPLVAMSWRRVAPFTACVVMAVALTAVGAGLGGTFCFFGGLLPFLVLVYSASASARSPYDRLVLLVPLALVAPMHAYISTFRIPADLIFATVVSLAAWTTGQGVRRWQHQSHLLAAALATVERGREDRERLALAEERTRIARELHDVVAHGMSVMVMQAGVARLDVQHDADAADAALAQIEEVGKAALLEMRRLVGIWRDQETQDIEPQPGMARLPVLLDGLTSAGLAIDHHTRGASRPLSKAQDVSAYRVIGEALTNALRHGAPGRVGLEVDWRTDRLAITVSNPIDRTLGVPAGGDGHGLIGIRERASLFGGRCRTGVTAGRYVTEVELPYDLEPV